MKYRVNGELPEIGKIAKRKIVTKIKECTCVSMTHINNGYKRSNEKWDTKFCWDCGFEPLDTVIILM